ncbi:MAG: ABC transporter ATP-binding protein [Gemmatimonadetes bacterium]|nr:ABC transporter ATP-binding protein [Gemmatimonadota bacterium]
MERRGGAFIAYFLRSYPLATAAMVALLILSGVAEGVGLAVLLPVLELATGEPAGERSLLARVTHGLLGVLGLRPTLATLLVLVVAGLALKALFRWLAMKRVGYTVARVAGDLRLRLIRALMAARWSYFASQPAGQFANAVTREAFWAGFAYRDACAALAGLIQLVVYAALVLLVSWEVAFLAVLAGGAIALLLGGFVRMSRRSGAEQTAVTRFLASRLTDVVQGIKAIKAMGAEERILPLFERETRGLRAAEQRHVLAVESLQSFQEPLVATLIAVGLYLAVRWGGEPFATLILLVFLFHRIVGRLHVVQTQYQAMAAAESAFWSLDAQARGAEAARERATGAQPPPALGEAIEFRGVSFAHEGTPVLREVSFTIPAGSFTVLTGPSGAGKTTIADLILGLHHPDAGEIRVDGQPLDALDLGAWRRRIGYVPQENILFHDSIAGNVSLGDERGNHETIEAALRDAGAWDFVTALPRGLDTVVGERGLKLSGGERQRIALARALARRPKLLVLDEATGELDQATEAAICATLHALRGRVTIVAVSHRPAVTEAADIVYELRDGVALERRPPASPARL